MVTADPPGWWPLRMECEESGPELWMQWLRLCLQVTCELLAVGESHKGSLGGQAPSPLKNAVS